MSGKKIEAFWVNATAFEVARVMKGETVEARFRDFEKDEWKIAVLSGWSKFNERDRLPWATCGGLCYMYCQVYREPSWYADKPDPGPGYRLLEKFPDEEPQLGDSVFCPGSEIWLELEAPFEPGQRHGLWYRRRIEAVEDPAGDWEPTDEEFQYAQDLCRVPKGICRVPVPMRSYDPTELKGLKIPQADGDFRKFVDKAKAGELSSTCSFVWEGPRVKVGDRIQHPNGCWLEITESGFKIEAALNTIEFTR
jgi:hypothetical protein